MKYLICLALLAVGGTSAVPIEVGYGIPAAPVVISAPAPAPVAVPAPIPVVPAAPVAVPAPDPVVVPGTPIVSPVAPDIPVDVVSIAEAPFVLPPGVTQERFRPRIVNFAGFRSAPVVPVTPAQSRFHGRRDESQTYNYGYSNALSAKHEVRDADGTVRGAYSYVDANGIVQHVQYIADAIHGFRVIGTNIHV